MCSRSAALPSVGLDTFMEVGMKCINGFLGLVVITLVAGVVVMYSGVINVAATNPHNPITNFVLGTTMDNSVRAFPLPHVPYFVDGCWCIWCYLL